MSEDLICRRDGAIIEVTLNRAAKKNALTGAMYDGMREALAEADRDPGIRAVLFAGTGGIFSAGNDLGDFLAEGGLARAFGFIAALATCETPLVAAVEGHAVGIGTTMLFHCDLVYAAPSARFRMPFIDLAVVPEAAASLLVPRRVGMAKASEWLLLGDAFDAAEAHRCGVVNAVVPADSVLATARMAAFRLAAKPPAALAATRRLLRGDRADIRARMEAEVRAFEAALQTPDAKAALAAFFGKASRAA